MAEICSCKTGIENFGQPNCVNALKRVSRLIFVNYRDDAGAINSIASTDTLDQTYFDGKFNATDVSQRWYITETINNVDGERADFTTQEADGINFVVRQGVREFNGTFWGGIASPTYIKSFESISCRQMGYFVVDVEGNIIGIENETTGDLDPIKIQRNTFQAKYMWPTADTVQGVNLKFNWEENERDSELSFVGSANISVDMLTQTSMSTVVISNVASITTTTFTFDMDFTYGEVFEKEPYSGAVIGDFTLLDNGGSPIVITSITETATEGTYDLVMPAQTSTDVLTFSYQKTSGTGFETTSDTSITIP